MDWQTVLMVIKISRFSSAEVDGSIARSNNDTIVTGTSSLGKAPELHILVTKEWAKIDEVLTRKPALKASPSDKLQQPDHLHQ